MSLHSYHVRMCILFLNSVVRASRPTTFSIADFISRDNNLYGQEIIRCSAAVNMASRFASINSVNVSKLLISL